MGLACLSCSVQFPCLVGLARARDNINKAANQSTVVKPYFAEIGSFHGASAQFPCLVGMARARDNSKKVANQSTVVKPYFAEIGSFQGACLLELRGS